MKKVISGLILTSLLVLPVMVLADMIGEGMEEGPPEVDIVDTLINVGNIMFGVLLGVAVIFLIAAAFLFVGSSGDPEKVKKARDMLLYGVIGIVVAAAARGIVSFITDVVIK